MPEIRTTKVTANAKQQDVPWFNDTYLTLGQGFHYVWKVVYIKSKNAFLLETRSFKIWIDPSKHEDSWTEIDACLSKMDSIFVHVNRLTWAIAVGEEPTNWNALANEKAEVYECHTMLEDIIEEPPKKKSLTRSRVIPFQ